MAQFIPYDDTTTADTRAASMWQAVAGAGWVGANVTQYLYGRRVRQGTGVGADGTDPDADLPLGVDFAIQVDAGAIRLDDLVRADELTQDEMIYLVDAYTAWSGSSVAYAIGDIASYNSQLWKCIQAHTSQADWQPPNVPALWQATVPAGVIPTWNAGQVGGYALGVLVVHPLNGRVWQSLAAGNSWEPGVVGTWRDQSLPPLWVAPAGAVGVWQIGDVVEHNAQNWTSNTANNSWEPGVFGWDLIV